MSNQDSGKVYHRKATGDALITVNKHDSDKDLTLFGGCFCPFVQRVWAAFEELEIPYKVCMSTPFVPLPPPLTSYE